MTEAPNPLQLLILDIGNRITADQAAVMMVALTAALGREPLERLVEELDIPGEVAEYTMARHLTLDLYLMLLGKWLALASVEKGKAHRIMTRISDPEIEELKALVETVH